MTLRLLALASLLATASPAAAQAPGTAHLRDEADRGLIASYPFAGDAVDEVTRAPAMSYGVAPAEGRDRRPAGALRFDGRRSYVNLGDRLAPQTFTVAAWIRPDVVGPTQVIVSRIRNAPGHYQKNLELRLDAGGVLFLHVPSGQGWEGVRGDRPIPAGRWTHVAATYDGRTAQLWVDGQADGQPLDVMYEQTRTETFIGARPEGGNPRGPTFFFGGLLSDVKLWDRALGAGELMRLAGRGGAQPPSWPPQPPPGPGYPGNPGYPGGGAQPVASWPLDRGDLRDAVGGAEGRASGPLRAAEDRRGDPQGAIGLTGREWIDAGAIVEPETLTIAAWVRPARVDRDMAILSKLSSAYGPRDRWLELRMERGGKVALGFPSPLGQEPVVRSTRPIAPNRWTHVAATFDGGRAVLYVDGQAAGEAVLAPFDASRGPLFLGARPDASGRRPRLGYNLEGRVDDVGLWRGALGAAEVARLADRTPTPPPPAPYEPPRPGYPPGPGGGWDDEPAGPLAPVARALARFESAVARRDAARLAAAEDAALRALEDAVQAYRGQHDAGGVVQRLRQATQELQSQRGRTDAMSLDRKRSALVGAADVLWDDLAHEVDERPF
ncbi:MAG: LamG domain-containing protein [Anaeromyxobacter sp.]